MVLYKNSSHFYQSTSDPVTVSLPVPWRELLDSAHRKPSPSWLRRKIESTSSPRNLPQFSPALLLSRLPAPLSCSETLLPQ